MNENGLVRYKYLTNYVYKYILYIVYSPNKANYIFMITVEQIKAARGLLEWSQDDLADAAILSRPAINNLERRVSKPHTNTIERIQKALEKAGIEFIDGGGRYRKHILDVEIFEGDSGILKINEDVY